MLVKLVWLIIISGLTWQGCVRIRKSLLLGGGRQVDLTLITRCLSIRPVIPGIQGNYKGEWLKVKETE
jgi:hypothetical protein